MQKISTVITDALSPLLEEYFCDAGQTAWVVEKIDDRTPPALIGYFDDAETAQLAYRNLRETFGELPEKAELAHIDDVDWKEEYKKFLTAWDCGGLHWVPVWMREKYAVPPGDKAFYFDAGLAFGTGDHPTTRLCMAAIMKALGEGNPAEKFFIDAGCGSGILSLSAKLMGAGRVFGFDRDEEAVRVSLNNAALNGIDLDGVTFEHSGIEAALAGKRADILAANIQADVLCIYAENIAGAVRPGGTLVLSGILGSENARVRELFEEKIGGALESSEAFFMGDWSSLTFKFKNR